VALALPAMTASVPAAADGAARPLPRPNRHACELQQPLGVVAGLCGLDHGGLAVGVKTREENARFHLGARDGQDMFERTQTGVSCAPYD